MDDRSASAKAIAWVSRITTISLMTVIPPMAGCFLDHVLGTVALFMFFGMVLGMVIGGWQLMGLVRDLSESETSTRQPVQGAEKKDSQADEL